MLHRKGVHWRLITAWTVTAAALVACLILTRLGHVVASNLSAILTAMTGLYSTYLQILVWRSQHAVAPAATDESGLVVVVHVRADMNWALWLEDRLNSGGFTPRLRQLPAGEDSEDVAAWAKKIAEDSKCLIIVSSHELRHAGDTAALRISAVMDGPEASGHVVFLAVHVDDRSAHAVGAQPEPQPAETAMRTVPLDGVRQEDEAWALVEDAVRSCGARSGTRRAELFGARLSTFPGLGATSSNLPAANLNFVGRRAEMDRLTAQLVDADGDVRNRCTALHAMAGMGKTQIAAQFANANTHTCFDTVWWVHASGAIHADLNALAQSLGVQPIADQYELLRRLWDKLRTHPGRWLIVYDNAESEEKLRDLLPPAGNGSILITSQSPNWSTLARHRFRLYHLSEEDALGMLRKHLPAADGQDLARIAEQLGRLPLALEQAAAYMRETQCPPGRYLRQLNRQFRETLRRGTPAYYSESAAATYHLARDLTTQMEPLSGVLLELCGFFSPDAIPRDLFEAPGQIGALPADLAAAVVTGVSYDVAVSAARQFSLLTVSATSFSMHRVVQKLIRESLTPLQREQRTATAVALLARMFPANPDDPGTWEACGALQSHCVSVLEEVEEHDLISTMSIRLSRMLGEYQRARGAFEDAQARLERTLAQLRNHLEDRKELAAIELALARVCFQLADLNDAKEHALAALDLHEAVLGLEHPRTAANLLDLSQIQLELSEFDAALDNARRSLKIYRKTNGASTEPTGLSLEALGIVQWRLGKWDEAKSSLTEALRLLTRAFGPDNGITARVRTVYGLVLRDSAFGDENRLILAEDELEHAHSVLVGAHGADHPTTVSAAIHLADTHRRKAVARQRRRGDRDLFAVECRRVAEEFEQAMRRQPMKAKKPGRACGLVRQGHLLNYLGEHVRARELVQEARGIYIQSYGADHPYVAEALTRLIAIEYDLDNPLEADRAAHEARRIYEQHYGSAHPYVVQIDAFLADPAAGGRD